MKDYEKFAATLKTLNFSAEDIDYEVNRFKNCVTPYEDYEFINDGGFKEAYHLGENHVIKFAITSNATADEQALLTAAQEANLGEIFLPTIFIPLDEPRKVYLIEDDDAWVYDPETDSYIENDQFCFNYAIIQPLVEIASNQKHKYKSLYTYTLNPEASPVSVSIFRNSAINDVDWLMEFINYYGLEKLDALYDFIEKYNIFDLHNSNLGYLNGKPIILDWLSKVF